MSNGDRPGREDSDLHLTWQERTLLVELVQQDIKAVNDSLVAIGRWTNRLEWRVGLLESVRAKLEALC